MNRKSMVYRLSLLGLLTALEVILAVVNIPQPAGLSITFNMIPVAIACIALGLSGGLTMGAVFGAISFAQCFGLIGFSRMGAILVQVAPFLTFVQRFGSRMLMALCTALVYRALRSRLKHDPVVYSVTGFCAAFFNTLFFMLSLVLIFRHTEYMQEAMAGRGMMVYIAASVGINAVVEMIVSAVLTGAVGTALKKARFF